MSRYLVTGRSYRGHTAGETFEATLDPAAEARALSRGDITVLEHGTPTIQPGSYRLPDAWSNTTEKEQEPWL